MLTFAVLATLLAHAAAQGAGTEQSETHPKLTWQTCTGKGSCTSKNGEVVIDSNWRWVHDKAGYTNCYTGNEWNKTICSDASTCTTNCVLEGADYEPTYGVSTSGNGLKLKFTQKNDYATNIGTSPSP